MIFYFSLSLKHWRLWGLITLCWPSDEEGDYWKEIIRKPEDGGLYQASLGGTTGKGMLEELIKLIDKNEREEHAGRITK